jgi:putative ABC transport system ATP-binding protein
MMVDVRDVTRTYGSGPNAAAALRGVTFTVGEGALIALRGRSGSGKTTLLNVIGGLDTPDGGTVHVAGHDVTAIWRPDAAARDRGLHLPVVRAGAALSAAENAGVRRHPGAAARGRARRCCRWWA